MKLDKLLQRALDIKSNERVLIVTDKKKLSVAKIFYSACKKLSKNTKIIIKPIGKHHGEEPTKRITDAMKKADVVLAPTTNSLTHTKARIAACNAGARIVSMPGIEPKKMMPAILENPFYLRKKGNYIKGLLYGASRIRVLSKSGTNLSFSFNPEMTSLDDGIFLGKGRYGNLPAGEVETLPAEGTSNGIIVIDIMQAEKKEIFAQPKTILRVERGKVVEITDKDCKLAKIFKKIKNSTNIAEFSIGINRKAKIIGNLLQDEKVYGTVHFAFGSNITYGGKVYSKIHLDAVIFKPTIYADDKLIMKDGKLLI